MAAQFFIALDQAVNCLVRLGDDGFGMADEMLSARAWRMRHNYPRLHVWINRIFWWDADHCQECYWIEISRKQLPSEYRRWCE